MNELIKYLQDNMLIDFRGEITLDTVCGFLREDDGREAQDLLRKVDEQEGVHEMLVTLADNLKEHLEGGVNASVLREQLSHYSES
ncbi:MULTISPECIES: hypothetical protein [unclassified Streptomyces]|uniref:hypothetical protein n=1 Tax=unclassified Streptomyces TaxID=2593676 RepID=UPI0033A872A6|nr:hypothetical protein OG199_38930 [Streptomyces sp. NBC_01176]